MTLLNHNAQELAGLTPIPSEKVKPPRIAESAVHMECKLKQVIELEDDDGKVTTDVVLGRVRDGIACVCISRRLCLCTSRRLRRALDSPFADCVFAPLAGCRVPHLRRHQALRPKPYAP